MKKIFFKGMLLTLICLFSAQYAFATTVEVEALTTFSSLNPSKYLEVKSNERVEFENGIIWEEGTVVKGQVLDVKQPTRGKRNASFKFFPISYTYNGLTQNNYQEGFIGKYSETGHIDKKKIATTAATTAGGLFFHIPFFSQGISLAKGVIKNPENNRLKSGVVQVYKDSPVSYIEEGKDILLQPHDVFYLKFKNNDNEDYPSKSHLMEVDEPNSVNSIQYENPEAQSSSSSIYTNDPEDVLREVEEGLR